MINITNNNTVNFPSISSSLPPSYKQHLIQQHIDKAKAKLGLSSQTNPSYSQITTYFDMGGLASCIWDFIQWSNPQNGEVFNTADFNTYLSSLFAQLKTAGMNQIDMAFAQVCDIDALSNGTYTGTSGNDVIAQLLQQMVSSNIIFPTGTNLLSIITSAAQTAGITISLSFGGENAAASDFTICQEGENPQGQADKLVTFMQTYNIGSVDFDIEGTNAGAFANDPNAVPFFTELKTQLSAQNKTVTLTIQGSLTQTVWGSGGGHGQSPSTFNGPLKAFFYDANNNPIFPNLFSGVNLMMYDSGAHYYLDAKVYSDDTLPPDWCIEDWLDIIGPTNAGMLRIGFQDATAYQLDSSSASGHTYDKPVPQDPALVVSSSDTPGTAAAKIFLQIQLQLINDGYTTPLGPCFWWPNYSGSRYAPGTNDQASFTSQPMNDFETALQNLGGGVRALIEKNRSLSGRVSRAFHQCMVVIAEGITALFSMLTFSYLKFDKERHIVKLGPEVQVSSILPPPEVIQVIPAIYTEGETTVQVIPATIQQQ